jgi:uncharacterized DUF497 family protein
VEFDWDNRKAAKNLKKHGVSFQDAGNEALLSLIKIAQASTDQTSRLR